MTSHKNIRVFLGTVVALAAVSVVCAGSSALVQPVDEEQCRLVVRNLGLADLALWYEAMHTRHPSQADMFAPFGDYPGAPEHFPSGSLAPPPRGRGGRPLPQQGVEE